MSGRTRPCDAATAAGRLPKADQFLEAAETIREFADDEAQIGDAYVTLCVHAGIAAADVLCCAAFGVHAIGDDHNGAAELLGRVRPGGGALSNAWSAPPASATGRGDSPRFTPGVASDPAHVTGTHIRHQGRRNNHP
jgi:hypothetical protein